MPEVIEQIISEPQMAIFQSTATINLFLAGVGSGKTPLYLIAPRHPSQLYEAGYLQILMIS